MTAAIAKKKNYFFPACYCNKSFIQNLSISNSIYISFGRIVPPYYNMYDSVILSFRSYLTQFNTVIILLAAAFVPVSLEQKCRQATVIYQPVFCFPSCRFLSFLHPSRFSPYFNFFCKLHRGTENPLD